MYFQRVTRRDDPGFIRAMALYAKSFPLHEQRLSDSQLAILGEEAYHLDQIIQDGRFLGAIFYWETGDFVYVEHFCMEPHLRGQGFGKTALELLAEKGKTVILEIDPPADDISRRRLGFYQRCGFRENVHEHIHPAYRPEYRGHELVVLSYPEALNQAAYDRFAGYLRDTVMGI